MCKLENGTGRQNKNPVAGTEVGMVWLKKNLMTLTFQIICRPFHKVYTASCETFCNHCRSKNKQWKCDLMGRHLNFTLFHIFQTLFISFRRADNDVTFVTWFFFFKCGLGIKKPLRFRQQENLILHQSSLGRADHHCGRLSLLVPFILEVISKLSISIYLIYSFFFYIPNLSTFSIILRVEYGEWGTTKQ